MAEIDLRALRDAQRQTAQTLAERDALTASLAARSAEITRLEAQAVQQARAGNVQGAATTRTQLAQAQAARAADLARIRAQDDALRDLRDRLALGDPCDADGAVPLLLLPVRVETRFATDRMSLRVRVYPDDVHIDQLDPGLDDPEKAAWQEYWTAVWRATDDQADAAWKVLVERVGKRRAAWIAAGVPPTNLADRATAPAPVFGRVTPRARRAAVARLLPDRFVAVAIQGADRRTAIGKPIAPEVTVGLLADDGSEFTEINGLKILPGAEWVVDYATAERLGMALTVPLARAGRVDRVVVMGVRRTLDAARTAAELERLMRAHQYTRGLGFVPQGTPTNNTEGDRAGWRARAGAARPSREVAAPPADGTNAQTLAAALGVDARLFATVDEAAGREQPRARAASTLFWGPTWGTFLDKINRVGPTGAAVSDTTIEGARAFHRDHVRGRGPLPALRVGNQPYGVLPVSALDALWAPTRGDALEGNLLGLVRRARAKWRQSVANVPRVGVGNIDEVMREVLGQAPVSGSLRVRTVLSAEAARAGLTVSNGDANTLAVETLIEELVWEEVIADASLVHRAGSLATKSRPLALPLAHDGDVAYMDALLGGTSPGKVQSVWQALLQLSWARAQREVDATGAKRFQEVIQFATAIPAADRARVTATAASASRMTSAALAQEADRMHALVIANREAPTLAEFQPVPASRKGYGELAFQATSEAARGALAAYAAWAHMRALARQAELREAMTELRTTTRDERRLLLGETLDCASHRLDAWCTALVERRRRQRRQATPAGLSVGAYGWVEDVDPTGDRRGDGGYVAAPSLAHAATAGILRSAYLSHNPTGPGGTGAFAVDLSSARVRTALHLIEGIRMGQPLPALLGYQVERAIHEAKLDRLILSLRTIAPLTQGKLSDRGENVPLSAIEALAASNVVDGVDLVEKFQGKVPTWNAARIQTSLNTKPTSNPYIDAGAPWPALTPAEWATVSGIIQDAAEACDAVADLLMAEGVHQLVMGNVARASAALDAAAGADAPPPEPHVIQTPVEGVPITHRLILVAAPGAGRPWNVARPRAAAEPRLEGWAGLRLGDPATVRVTVMKTLAETGLCALDVVYDAGNRTALEQRVRAALGLAPDTPLLAVVPAGSPPGTRAFGEVAEHAAALHTLLTSARAAGPSDLTRHSDADARAFSRPDIDACVARATVAQGGLRTAVSQLAGAIAAGPLNEAALRAALERVAAFGVAAPTVSGEQLQVLATAAHAEAERRVADADAHLAAARAAMALPDAPAARSKARDSVLAAGQALFGDGFWIVPAVDAPPQADLWQLALAPGALAVPAGAIRRFLADVASVRPSVRRAGDALLLAEALGQPATLRVAQLATPGAPGTARWVGGPLDPAAPSPTEPVTDCVVDVPAGYDGKGPTAALVVDQWTDVVPVREARGQGPNAPIDERTTAGVSFNANAPSARAPQAMLLAVSPNDARWTTDALLATLLETLDLAKLRLVTLERTNGAARVLPALYAQSWSLQGEPALDFSFLTGPNAVMAAVPPYVKE